MGIGTDSELIPQFEVEGSKKKWTHLGKGGLDIDEFVVDFANSLWFVVL